MTKTIATKATLATKGASDTIAWDTPKLQAHAIEVLAAFERSDIATDRDRGVAIVDLGLKGATDAMLADVLTELRGRKASRQYVIQRRQAVQAVQAVGVELTPDAYETARKAYGVSIKGAAAARDEALATIAEGKGSAATKWKKLCAVWDELAARKSDSVSAVTGNRSAGDSAGGDETEAAPAVDTSTVVVSVRPAETVIHWLKFAQSHAWSADDRAAILEELATTAVALELAE